MSKEEMIKESELNMPSEKAVENKVADKKARSKMILVAVVGGVIGLAVGVLSGISESVLPVMMGRLLEMLNWVTPFANLVITSVVWILVTRWMRQARELYSNWDGEDESVIEKVELKIGYGLMVTTINMVLGFFFFGMGYYAVDLKGSNLLSDVLPWIRFAGTMIGFFYELTITTIYQKKLVNMTKEINPEKQGSVYDFKFQKIWMESCDESELLAIYKAGFAAYKTINYLCMGLEIFCVVGMYSWNFGVMPIVLVTVIWLTLTIRYEVEAIRLSKLGASVSQNQLP